MGERPDGGAVGTSLRNERLGDGVDELVVQRVAGVAGHHVPHDGAPQEGQVADQIEDLVADELVAVAEARVQHSAPADDHGVLEGAAAGEAVVAQRLHVLEEAVRPGAGHLLHEHLLGAGERGCLRPHGRVIHVQRVAHAEVVRGQDLEPALVVAHADRLGDQQGAPRRHERRLARRVEQRDERLGAAVHGRDFLALDLHQEVVDPQRRGRRHQVLDGSNAGPVHAERRGEAGVHDGVVAGGNEGAMGIGGAEDDAAVSRSGRESDLRGLARMEPDAFCCYPFPNRQLKVHWIV